MTLKFARNEAFKLKNHKTRTSFAKRLLTLKPAADVAQQTRKVSSVCGKNLIDEHPLNYDGYNSFDIFVSHSICQYI
ncbi:unnamed protein product, partial [Rotaria sp. Silwood2]